MAGRDDWWWCDALFMAPPGAARLSAATGDPKYLDWMDRQWWDCTDLLYDKTEHLYSRDKSFFGMRESNGQKVFWSRGNGWVLAGIARVLAFMPNDYPSRRRYIELFTEMADRIASLQGPDGLWRTSLLDPDSYPRGESSGTALFCFAMAWGVNAGILPADKYRPLVERAWSALTHSIETSGRIDWVQLPGSRPTTLKKEDTAEYGAGAFLLAGCEMLKLPPSR
jgi:rhamnogalacturonyl hydrolase YesR